MRKSMPISIRPAEEKDRQLVKNIFNLYQDELSVYSNDFEFLDENGYFAPETVNEILPFGDGVFPYIIEENARPIGFVMATDQSYAPDGADFCLEELFLIRKKRGTGAAECAMKEIFKNRAGKWALEVYRENARAVSFWTRFLDCTAENISKTDAPPFIRFFFTVK